MATGTTDPIRRGTDKTWEHTLQTLTGPKTDPNGGIYCQEQGGEACNLYYHHAVERTGTGDACDLDEDGKLTVMDALNNCTQLAPGQSYDKCQVVHPYCEACANACKEAVIEDVKEQILPASIFVFILCGYLVVVVVFNNIGLLGVNEDIPSLTKTVGMVLNGTVALLAFILVIMAAVASYYADEACTSDSDCVPDTLALIIVVGLGLMAVGIVILAGIQLGNALFIRIGTIVLVFLSLLCLLTGLIMGISSGAVMDDMSYYYDSNYPRLREALEVSDPSYCKMTKDDCSNVANNVVPSVSPKICNEDYSECDPVEDADEMTSDQLWLNMWSVAAEYASDATIAAEQQWLENCESTGICIFCSDFYESVQNAQTPQLTPDGDVLLCAGASTEDSTDDTPCYAANLNWKDAVTPPSADLEVPGRWALAQKEHAYPGNDPKLKLRCAQGGTARCPVEESTFPNAGAACTDLAQSPCEAVDGCAFIGDTCVLQAPMAATNDDETGWADLIFNFTQWQSTAWIERKTRCEMALVEHTALSDQGACKGAGDLVPEADKFMYMADCDACNDIPDFSFSSGLGSSYCLNYFVGHYEDVCDAHAGVSVSDVCRAEFHGSDDVAADVADRHVSFMVERAYEAGGPPQISGSAAEGKASRFCGYTDAGCKAKIKHSVEGSLSVIGYFGLVFIIFFIAIIFFTLQAVKIYYTDTGEEVDEEDL